MMFDFLRLKNLMSMKKFAQYILTAAAAVTLFAACDLNLLPNNSIAYDESGVLIQTASNLKSFENGLHASFRGMIYGAYTMPEEYQMDCWNATVDYGNNYGSIHRTDVSFTSSDYDAADTWEGYYPAIKNFNIMISNADKVDDALKADATIAKGYALFYRAYAYLTLAHQYGKIYGAGAASDLCVPLVLVYDQTEQPERATVAAVYTQIKADLDAAATILSGKAGAVRSEKPTIDAVNALYARYFLDIKDYSSAASYAHKVIDTATYTLASTAEAMEAEYINDEGTEPIMQMFATLTEGSNGNNNWTLEASDGTYGSVFKPYYIPTKTLIEAYDADDLRLAYWFDNKTAVQIAGTYYVGDFYTFVKYVGNPSLTSSPIRNGRQKPKPFKIGELYLIAAEAEAAGNNPTAATADLNALQKARGAQLTDGTMDNIQKEWMKETIGDAFRKNCLKRWGLGFSGRVPQDAAENVVMHGENYDGKNFPSGSTFFEWPIPANDMKINKNLVQNPGYDGM